MAKYADQDLIPLPHFSIQTGGCRFRRLAMGWLSLTVILLLTITIGSQTGGVKALPERISAQFTSFRVR